MQEDPAYIEVAISLVSRGPLKERDLQAMLRIYPANQNRPDAPTGDYSVMLSRWGHPRECDVSATVQGFDRQQGPWTLIRQALEAVQK